MGQVNQTTEEYLEELFNSNQTYEEITAQADAFFAAKYPGISNFELTQGEHRDGKFVKYQRWKAFWKNHLNDDGTLGDITQNANQLTSGNSRGADCSDYEFDASWNNVNYATNMGWQIDQGRTSSMAFHPTDPNTYYIGAAFGGLWKTTDGGVTQTLVNDNLPLSAVAGIIIDPTDPDHIAIGLSDIVWYGPRGIGVYVSTDGGTTFTPSSLSWELTINRKIYYMDQDPTDPNSICVATSAGIYKTDDFFATHDLVKNGNMRSVKYSQNDPNIVFAGGNNGQFYRSTDGGDNFSLVTDMGSNDVRIAVSTMPGSSRIVATCGSTLYKSTDDGLTFTTESLPESNMVIEFEPGSQTVLNIGNFEVYRSNDFGASFTVLTHWYADGGLPFIHVDQRNVFVNPLQDDYVYFCNDGGIFRYDNDADEFANLSADMYITQYYDIAVSQTEELVLGGGSQDNGNIFREDDGSWGAYAQTGDGMGQDIDPTDANVRYWSYQYGSIRRWESGSNSNIAPPGEDGNGEWEAPFKLDPSNSDRLVIGYAVVYESFDNGDSWTQVGDDVTGGPDLEQLAIAPSNGDKIYAIQNDDIYVKSPGVDAWEVYTLPSGQEVTDLEVDPLDENTVYICYAGYSDGNKVFKSTDGGENWTNITENLPNLPYTSLELYHDVDGAIFVGTIGAVYYLDNTTTDWRKFGCLPNTGVNDIEIQYFTNKIYAGTHGRGIFEASLDALNPSTAGIEDNVSDNITMYPNPAVDFVKIQSSKEDFTNCTIQVNDVTGRMVEVPFTVNNANEIELNVDGIIPGNYLVNIYDGELLISTQKLNVE